MNFDLIKKLIRLANNNPNENEANLAARKVCSLLADYSFNETSKPNPSANPRRNDIWDMYNDLMRRNQEHQKKQEEQRKKEQQDYYNQYYYDEMRGFDWSRANNDFRAGAWDKKTQSERPEQKLRKCIQCEKEVMTRRVTNVFRCNECEWNEYKEKTTHP